MCYLRAKEADLAETRSYRAYVTDSLRLNGENKYYTVRWLDMITPQPPPPPEDPRSCGEIAAGIWQRIRG